MNDVTEHSIEDQIRAWADDLAEQVPAHGTGVAAGVAMQARRPRYRRRTWLSAAAATLIAVPGIAVVANKVNEDVVTERVEPASASSSASSSSAAPDIGAGILWIPLESHIDAATIDDAGTTLTLAFVGGAEYDANQSCSRDYRASVDESRGEIVVRVDEGWPPSGWRVVCRVLAMHARSVSVELETPLGDRVVRDRFGVIPVRRAEG